MAHRYDSRTAESIEALLDRSTTGRATEPWPASTWPGRLSSDLAMAAQGFWECQLEHLRHVEMPRAAGRQPCVVHQAPPALPLLALYEGRPLVNRLCQSPDTSADKIAG